MKLKNQNYSYNMLLIIVLEFFQIKNENITYLLKIISNIL